MRRGAQNPARGAGPASQSCGAGPRLPLTGKSCRGTIWGREPASNAMQANRCRAGIRLEIQSINPLRD